MDMEKELDRIAAESRMRCGCSYEVYIDQFSAGVDVLLDGLNDTEEKAALLCLARESDYHTRSEVAEMQQSCLDSGSCIHGIDPDCCPAGCGDME